MKTITVRDIPDDLYANLKRLAARNHCSLQGQALVLLERARLERLRSPWRRAKEIRRSLAGRDLGDTVAEVRGERER